MKITAKRKAVFNKRNRLLRDVCEILVKKSFFNTAIIYVITWANERGEEKDNLNEAYITELADHIALRPDLLDTNDAIWQRLESSGMDPYFKSILTGWLESTGRTPVFNGHISDNASWNVFAGGRYRFEPDSVSDRQIIEKIKPLLDDMDILVWGCFEGGTTNTIEIAKKIGTSKKEIEESIERIKKYLKDAGYVES